jgi:ribosome biogenesis GTPase / thiamine phosphate phosphatase
LSSSSLDAELGWLGCTAELRAAAAPHLTGSAALARVSRVDRGAVETIPAGRASLGLGLAAAAGDWAVVATGSRPEVTLLLPRRNALVRGSANRSSAGQVLAANVDIVVVVDDMATGPNLRRLERLLALGWQSGAEPLVVLTKSDLAAAPDVLRHEVTRVAPGVPVLAVSAVTGEGLDGLRSRFSLGVTAALVGVSGVGKSSLANALLGVSQLPTSAIRADGKGRHTTSARHLLVLPRGGLLLDTPGLRGVELWEVDDGLSAAFVDVEGLADGCRFSDCNHDREPGCAVIAATEDGRLAPERLGSWRKLRREAEWAAARTDARLRAEQSRRRRLVARGLRRQPSRP